LPPVLPERSSKIGYVWDFQQAKFSFQFYFLKDDILSKDISQNIKHRGGIHITKFNPQDVKFDGMDFDLNQYEY